MPGQHTIGRRGLVMIVAALAMCGIASWRPGTAATAPHRSALDLNYAPTPDGRYAYDDAVAGILGAMIGVAPLCGARDQEWADNVEAVLIGTLDGPRPGVQEPDADSRLHALNKARVAAAKADARDEFLRYGRKRGCKPLQDRDDMRVLDGWARTMSGADGWAGAGGH